MCISHFNYYVSETPGCGTLTYNKTVNICEAFTGTKNNMSIVKFSFQAMMSATYHLSKYAASDVNNTVN